MRVGGSEVFGGPNIHCVSSAFHITGDTLTEMTSRCTKVHVLK
jgi:hypothetical protein